MWMEEIEALELSLRGKKMSSLEFTGECFINDIE